MILCLHNKQVLFADYGITRSAIEVNVKKLHLSEIGSRPVQNYYTQQDNEMYLSKDIPIVSEEDFDNFPEGKYYMDYAPEIRAVLEVALPNRISAINYTTKKDTIVFDTDCVTVNQKEVNTLFDNTMYITVQLELLLSKLIEYKAVLEGDTTLLDILFPNGHIKDDVELDSGIYTSMSARELYLIYKLVKIQLRRWI